MSHEGFGRRATASLGDTWHFGIVTVTAAQRAAVRDVLGLRRGHTGKVAAPSGVAYLVVAHPTGPGGPAVTAALADLRDRYDPVVLVLVETADGAGGPDVLVGAGSAAVTGAVDGFFAASGEPAPLPGYRGAAPFLVGRGPLDSAEAVAVTRFCRATTTRRGRRPGWVVVHGHAAVPAAQTLRYLIPYVRPRL